MWDIAKTISDFEGVKEALRILHAREKELQDEALAASSLEGVVPGAEVWYKKGDSMWLRGTVRKLNARTVQVVNPKTGRKHAIPPQVVKLYKEGVDPYER
jgi:hypothetical protein